MVFHRLDYGVLLALFVVATGKEVLYEFVLESVIDNAYSPDCMNVKSEYRSMFLANASFPGPTIEADEGDTITVRVYNTNSASSVSLHFHGIHQNGSPYSDGASFITQCPLGPLQSQEYVFQAYPPGTHFWHDHGSFHVADGITGPIIVHPKDPEPFTYDEEMTIFLQDWYIETGTQQLDGLNSWLFVFVGNPNSLLINGKGIAPECQPNGTSFNNTLFCLDTCQGDPLALLDTVNVTEGMTYRLRLINSGQLVMVNFAITGHNMTIVQVEGTNLEPLEVASIDIAPGQRYDVLVTADQTPGSYMIETTVRARPIEDVKGRAILQYVGAAAATVLPEAPTHPLYNDTAFGVAQDLSLKTLNVNTHYQASALNATEVTRYILVGTQNQYIVDGTPKLLRWAVNNISSMHGSDPIIGKAFNTAQLLGWPATIEGTVDLPVDPPFVWNYTMNLTSPGGPGVALGTLEESVVKLKEGEVVEFILQNTRAINGVAEFHPWHAHGHSFWVVGQGAGVYNPDTDVANYNLNNPVLRDTVTLQPLSWVALRFVADNPGAWLFHCHILSHQVMGMEFVMITEPDALGALPANVEYCNDQQLKATSTGGAPTNGTSGSPTNGTSKNSNTTSSSGPLHLLSGLWATALIVLLALL